MNSQYASKYRPRLRAREHEVYAAVPTPESWPPDTPAQPALTSTSTAYDLSKPASTQQL